MVFSERPAAGKASLPEIRGACGRQTLFLLGVGSYGNDRFHALLTTSFCPFCSEKGGSRLGDCGKRDPYYRANSTQINRSLL
eukprot:3893018-Pleurochrysis_carterae.AAC.1